MSVKVKKQSFVAGGKEFETRKEADAYDALQTARNEYQDAQRKFQSCLAESQRTADGEQFEFGVFHDYYMVSGHGWLPGLQQVSFMCWNWTVAEDEKVGVRIKNDDKERWYAITDLYAGRRNAERALAHRQENELESLVEEANRLRDTVGLEPLRLCGHSGGAV